MNNREEIPGKPGYSLLVVVVLAFCFFPCDCKIGFWIARSVFWHSRVKFSKLVLNYLSWLLTFTEVFLKNSFG